MKCIDCGVQITTGKKRCNKCNAANRPPEHYSKGWKKYEYNGIRYRSTWEIEFAKILTDCKVDFAYELLHEDSKTRPDFYIHEKKMYVEIHPDYHGKKKFIPDNCILVKSLSHARAVAYSICFRLNKTETIRVFEKMSRQAKIGVLHVLLSLAETTREAIYERDGK